jgi:hypothetical protein
MRVALAALALAVVAGIVAALLSLTGGGDDAVEAPGPTAGESAEVREYREAATRLGRRYRGAADTLSSLSNGAQPADDAWRAQYRSALDDLKTVSVEVRALRPPECLTTVQDNLLAAATRYDRAVAQGERGLETDQPQSFRQAGQTVAEADQFLTTATELAANAQC